MDGDLYLNGGTIDLNGHKLTVYNSLVQSNGTMYVHGGQVIVTGNYRIQTKNADGTYSNSYGILVMTNAADYVQVGGGFVTQSYYSHNTYLTAGTLEVKGDFTQKLFDSSSGHTNFNASGSHKVVLSGTSLQTVYFESPDYSRFNILELNTSSLKFTSALAVNKVISNGNQLPSLTVGPVSWTLYGNETVDGDLYLNGSTLNLAGETLTIKGKLIQSSGTLLVNSGRIIIMGPIKNA